jgi:hypothetical protein
MGLHSRNKGKRGEREAAAVIAQHWNATAARRSQQFCGRDGDADLTGVPGMHLEVKRYARIAALDFLEQAEMDATPGSVPVVLMREDTSTEWVAMVRVSDAPEFARRVMQLLGENAPAVDPDAHAGGLE